MYTSRITFLTSTLLIVFLIYTFRCISGTEQQLIQFNLYSAFYNKFVSRGSCETEAEAETQSPYTNIINNQ